MGNSAPTYNPDGTQTTVMQKIVHHVTNAKDSVTALHGLITGLAAVKTGSSEYSGGGFFDGGDDKKPLDSILAYRNSKSHESKNAVAGKIIEALKSAGVSVRENGDMADVAKSMAEKLPDPHKGQSYKVDSESQKNVVRALIKGLNNAFSPGAPEELMFIPPSYSLEELARQAMELVYSMTTGVHDEFMTVQASVVNALHNVKVLRKLMDSAHNEVVSQANNLINSSDRDTGNYTAYQEIYKRIAKECDRQITMLSNMLDSTMGPEMKVIQQLADETSADYKYIKKYVIGKDMDLKTSASVIAHLVHGISATAVMLTSADKVFAELGGQMMHLKGATEEAVDRAIDELILKDPANAAKYIKWKVTIKMYNEEHRVREDTMDKHRGLGSNIDARRAIVGNADIFEERKSKYAVNYKKSIKERQIIFSDYISKSSAIYAKLLAAVDAIGPRIGGEIPISDKLMDLREAFASLADEQLGGGGLEKALIGFDLEITGRQRRDAFMNKLRLVKTVLEQVVNMSVYSGVRQYFDPMVSAVNSMVEQSDMYYDIVKQKYGSKEGGDDGDEDDYQLPEVARSAHDLRKSVNSFIYYMYVAKVRANLKQTNEEVVSYGEKYTQLLGEAVACRLREIEGEYTKETALIDDVFDAKNLLKAVAEAKSPENSVNHACYANHKLAKEACKKYSKKQYECKKNFYRSLQAVDLYLKEFTEGVTAHPEDIAEIKQMLTGVDLIGPWYDDKTGNNLAHGFDAFGNIVAPVGGVNPASNNRPLSIWLDAANFDQGAVGAPPSLEQAKLGYVSGVYDFHAVKDDDKLASNVHYYTRLAASNRNIGNPAVGNTFNLLRADHRKMAEIAVARFSETYDNFQALKNIINAIVRMGDKFGNKELRNTVFLSPSEIFKNLMAYLKCSATTFEFSKGNFDTLVTNAKRHVVNAQGGTGGLLAVIAPAAAGDASLVDVNQPAAEDDRDMGFWYSPAGAVFPVGAIAANLKNGVRDSTLVATLKVGAVGANMEFQTEDNYFQMIVKAMATKILTVIGVYDLFNRPGPVYDLTPTRMIIGGAMDQVEIIPEATELYFRLTRLAEYYRNTAFTSYATAMTRTDERFIGFIPDVAGVFSGLTKLIWLKFGLTTVDQGSYSDSELRQLIKEINDIYHHFKGESEHSVTSKACNEFVMEINRRYGVIKKSDYENYFKMMREVNSLSERSSFNNFAILPGEGELRAKRAAPSDTYMSVLSKTDIKLNLDCETKLDVAGTETYKTMLNKFRKDLNDSFEEARGNNASDYNKFVNISYSARIKQAEAKMRKESEVERFNTAAQLIRGSDGLASTDVARDFFFHETVVTGLNTLTAITKMLQHIRASVGVMIGAVAGGMVAIATAVGNADYKDSVQLTGTYGTALVAPNAGAAGAPALLRDIIILVNGLNNSFGDKVKVRFPQGRTSQLLVDFTDLSNSLEDLMDSTRYFINLMRQTMPRGTIEKYEGAHDNLTEGTYRWLEVNLSDQLLKGKNNQYSTPTAENYNETTTLTYIATEINNMYTYIVHNFNDLRPAISELVYYIAPLSTSVPPAAAVNPAVPNTIPANSNGGAAASAAAVAVAAADYIGNSNINSLIADKPATRKSGQTTVLNRTYFNHIIRTWTGDNLNTTRSMMMLFNQLLAMYLRTFYDESSGKTYRGLIESFASGSFNQAVTSVGVDHVFTDLYYNVNPEDVGGNSASAQVLATYREAQTLNAPRTQTNHAANGIIQLGNNLEPQVVAAPAAGGGNPPPPTNVLLQSLALILQRLMTDNTREGVSEHLISTLSEVPMFIREKMRAYLPVFSKMFNMVQQQGEFIKQLLEQTDLVLGAHQSKSEAAEVRDRNTMTACINKIVDGCFTLANSSSDVCRELADEPKFLQTQENSIRDYQTRYGKLPLMPLSSVLNYLSILNNGNENILMPTHSLGTPEFKMMYGTRGLLHDHVWKSSSAPGVSQVLEQYRASSSAGVDESKYEKLVAGVVGVVQSLVDLRYFSTSTTINTVVTVLGNILVQGNVAIAANVVNAGAPSGADIVANAAGIMRNSVFKPGRLFAGANAVVNPLGGFNPATLPVSDNNLVVYQLQRPAAQPEVDQGRTLSLTESSGQAAQLQHITQAVGSTFSAVTNADSRKIERMYNIVDMNIIPVNVHALMRGMPLAPLYNYTYTFEENARLALGISTNAALAAHEPTTAREWFYKILENPYYDVVTTARNFGGLQNNPNIANTTIDAINAMNAQAVAAWVVPGAGNVVTTAINNADDAVVNLINNTWNSVRNTVANQAIVTAVTTAKDANNNNPVGAGNNASAAEARMTAIRAAIQAGAFSSPAAPGAGAGAAATAVGQPGISADALIALLTNAGAADAVFNEIRNSDIYLEGGTAAGNLAASAGRLQVILVARRAITNLILVRNRARNRLSQLQIRNINTAIARVIMDVADDDSVTNLMLNNIDNIGGGGANNTDTDADVFGRIVVAGANSAVQVNSVLNDIIAIGNGGNDSTFAQNDAVISLLPRIGILAAMVNSIDRLNRYNLDRHSPNDRTLAALMHGDETLLMGRPKFISDQLFHKVLPTLDSSGRLNYYANGASVQVPAANVAPFNAGQINAFRQVFEARFNTRIVRNLMHCTNVQRVLRLRLNQELTSYRDVLVNRESITNPSVTEFGNLRWSDMRLDDTRNRTMDPRNEDARSRTYNSEGVVGIPR
jgi:hypothetical protein